MASKDAEYKLLGALRLEWGYLVDVHPSGDYLLVRNSDPDATRLIKFPSQEVVFEVAGYYWGVFSTDYSTLRVENLTHYRILDVPSGKLRLEIEQARHEKIHFSPDPSLILIENGHGQKYIKIIDLETGAIRYELEGYDFRRFTPKDKAFIAQTGNRDTSRKTAIVDLETGRIRAEAESNFSISFSNDGRFVILYHNFIGKIYRIEIATGKVRQRFEALFFPIHTELKDNILMGIHVFFFGLFMLLAKWFKLWLFKLRHLDLAENDRVDDVSLSGRWLVVSNGERRVTKIFDLNTLSLHKEILIIGRSKFLGGDTFLQIEHGLDHPYLIEVSTGIIRGRANKIYEVPAKNIIIACGNVYGTDEAPVYDLPAVYMRGIGQTIGKQLRFYEAPDYSAKSRLVKPPDRGFDVVWSSAPPRREWHDDLLWILGQSADKEWVFTSDALLWLPANQLTVVQSWEDARILDAKEVTDVINRRFAEVRDFPANTPIDFGSLLYSVGFGRSYSSEDHSLFHDRERSLRDLRARPKLITTPKKLGKYRTVYLEKFWSYVRDNTEDELIIEPRIIHTKPIEEYLALPYTLEIIPDGEGYFVQVKELPGCMTTVDNEDQIHPMIEDAKRLWIKSAWRDCRPIPLADFENLPSEIDAQPH